MGRTLIISVLITLVSLGWAQENEARSIVGGSYTLAAGETLTGDLNTIGADITLEQGSMVSGHLTALGGTVTVNGTVSKDVHVYGGELMLGDSARIEGTMTTNWATFERAPGATVVGALETTSSDQPIRFSLPEISRESTEYYTRATQPETPVGILVRSLSFALLAALLMLLAPRALGRVEEAVTKHPARSAGVGFVAGLVALLVLVLLAITLIGIPLALAVAFLLFATVIFGWTALGSYVGTYLERAFKQKWSAVVRTFIGTLALGFAGFVLSYLPVVGGLVSLGLVLVALGAVFLTRFGTRSYQPPVVGPRLPEAPQPQV
jgi:cytoskeletal protein CcmA (bactofilin family)